MNTDALIRLKALEQMAELKLTQVALAEKLGVKPQSVNQILKRQKARIPESLTNLLEALNLELTVQPKPKHPAPSSGVTEEEDA